MPTDRHLTFEEERFAALLLEATAFKVSSSGPQGHDNFVDFSSSNFFDSWFKREGTPLYFLFKKNLSVTNIQFAELLSLIQALTVDKEGKRPDIQFASNKEFTSSLRDLISDFQIRDRAHARKSYRWLARHYHALTKRTVVIDPYYGSCSVFLPPGLNLDLARLCAESGYVHSCGRHIYVRNVNKANFADLVDALGRHLTSYHPRAGKVYFVVYTHEDFTKGDIEERKETVLVHGISELKVHIEKFYMGRDRLVSIVKRLENDTALGSRLEIPPAGDYRFQHIDGTDRANTIWLLRDRSVGPDVEEPGDTVYYICYDQLYKNENPFHIFDENKPAWIEHTTTPQTLICAMLNVTRGSWRGQTRVCDPFVGTGTTLLEALKFDGVQVTGRDTSALSAVVCRDNLDFFASSSDELRRLRDEVLRSKEAAAWRQAEQTALRGGKSDAFTIYMTIKDFFLRLEASTGEFKIRERDEEKLADLLSSLQFHEKIDVYLRLRVIRRRTGAFLRGTLRWEQEFKEEADQLLREIQELSALRDRKLRGKQGEIDIVQGRYSGYCTYSPELLRERWRSQTALETGSVEELPKKSYDVIIADPPYGFNTDEKTEALAELYSNMIPTMVAALRDGGQLVMALPERSYIGRHSPYFTHKEIVTQQIVSAGVKTDLELMVRSVPEPTRLYRPPYYWRSEKALARTILHFRFRGIEGQQLSKRPRV